MDLTEEAAEDVTVVSITGRLDTQTAGRFSGRLSAAPNEKPLAVVAAKQPAYRMARC